MLDPNVFLPVLSFVLLSLLFIFAIISLLNTSEPGGVPCPLGFCATNIYDGSRRCPTEGNVEHNPAYETCNAPDACTSQQTPCLYLSPELGTSCPGDSGYTGVCQGTCRCLERVVCPNWATVYFTPLNVNNFTSLVQNTSWVNAVGTVSSATPLSPQVFGEGNGLCGVSTDSLSKIWPPGACVKGKLGLNEVDGLWYCMSTDLECSGTLFRNSRGEYVCL